MFYIPCFLPLLLYLNLFFQTFSIKRKSFTNSSCFVNSISPMSSSNIFTSPGNPEFTKWMSFMKKIFLQVLFLIFHRYYILKQKVSLAKKWSKSLVFTSETTLFSLNFTWYYLWHCWCEHSCFISLKIIRQTSVSLSVTTKRKHLVFNRMRLFCHRSIRIVWFRFQNKFSAKLCVSILAPRLL